jgi:hypothetical protein
MYYVASKKGNIRDINIIIVVVILFMKIQQLSTDTDRS